MCVCVYVYLQTLNMYTDDTTFHYIKTDLFSLFSTHLMSLKLFKKITPLYACNNY